MLPSKGEVTVQLAYNDSVTYEDVADVDVRDGFVVIQRWVKEKPKKNKVVKVERIPGSRVLDVTFHMLAAHELWSR